MFNFIRQRREAERERMDRLVRDAVRSEATKLQTQVADASIKRAQAESEASELRNTLAETKRLLREQAEADAVLASLRVIANVLAGQPRNESLERHQQELATKLAGMQNQASPQFYGGGLGALLGSVLH